LLCRRDQPINKEAGCCHNQFNFARCHSCTGHFDHHHLTLLQAKLRYNNVEITIKNESFHYISHLPENHYISSLTRHRAQRSVGYVSAPMRGDG
jgi:hypothetical protein